MALKRHLAAVIWAAVLVVAVQCAPGIALAHGGHNHAPAPHAVPSPSDEDVPQAGGDAAQNAAPSMEIAAPDRRVDPATTPSGACNGSCCGKGTSCCGPALPPAGAAGPPLHCRAPPPFEGGGPMRSGIDPEALPKPPKSFA
jgi:hypothetical protein